MVLIAKRAALAALILVLESAMALAQATNAPPPTAARPLLYGFALECISCTPGEVARGRVGGGGRGASPVVWSYSSYPRVVAVAPGSAAEQAGIRTGDILRAIDGLSLLTLQGSQRFASAQIGDEVKLAFERNTKAIDVSLVLGPRSGGRGSTAGPTHIATGYVALHAPAVRGPLDIEIWSDDPVYVTPDSTASGDSVLVGVIRIGTTIIKLRIGAGGADSTGASKGRGRGKPEPDASGQTRPD